MFSRRALTAIERDDDLRISPLVLLELEYLHEIKHIKVPVVRMANGLQGRSRPGCETPFDLIVHKALEERWTRDPFDRMIVAQARLHDAALITLDQHILNHYPQALAYSSASTRAPWPAPFQLVAPAKSAILKRSESL